MMRGWIAACLLAGACVNSEDGPFLIEGTTYRIGEPEQIEDHDLTVEVFTSREACLADRAVATEDVEDCLPRVDRATGQVHLAFAFQDNAGHSYELPLEASQVVVTHDGLTVPGAAELTPHEPLRASQLFIVLMDGSGSMYRGDQPMIDKVYRALMRPNVIDAFFPNIDNVATGVVLLRFTDTVEGLDGGPPRVIENRREYEQLVRQHIASGNRGYTHLYDSIEYSINELPDAPGVKEWLALRRAEPTVIAITDGFNNEQASDQCGVNATRLNDLLQYVDESQSRDLYKRPKIYTVGLGAALRPNWDYDDHKANQPSPDSLCGRYQAERIDGNLENIGIDNVSLEWIAQRGGGETYVAESDRRLSEVFLDAAAIRYGWYELDYAVDPYFHRRTFRPGMQLRTSNQAGFEVPVHPSGWLDAPTPRRRTGSVWTEPRGMRASIAFALPILSGFVLLYFLGPATFNGRRAVTRRARGSRKTKK